MKRRQDIIFDFKSLGIQALIPWVGMFITFPVVLSFLKEPLRWMYILSTGETVIPISIAWVTIFLFQDLLEEAGSEVIFSYPVKRSTLGILKVLPFYLIYLLLPCFFALFVQIVTKEQVFLSLFLQLAVEGMFLTALGFAFVTTLSNCAFALCGVITYLVTMVMTKGENFELVNIFLFNEKILSFSKLWPYLIKPLLFSLVLFSIGQWKIHHYKNFK